MEAIPEDLEQIKSSDKGTIVKVLNTEDGLKLSDAT